MWKIFIVTFTVFSLGFATTPVLDEEVDDSPAPPSYTTVPIPPPPPPPKCKKANEIYNECPPTCPQRYCGIDDRVIRCAAPPKKGSPDCPPPACICKPGFYRDDKGGCVKWEQCPKCNSTNNEVYNPCYPPCPGQSCDVNIRNVLCVIPPKLGDPNCQGKCICKGDLVRNDQGMCITRDQCPKCKKPNEVYVECPNRCDPNTCESIGKNYKCPLEPADGGAKKCIGQCKCKPGFYYNKIGECVSKENCLKCTKPHEYYSCGGACDNVCATLKYQNQTNCPIVNIKCNEMCYCEKGYARDSDGNCVQIEDCKTCKSSDEVFDECYTKCRPETCDQLGYGFLCSPTEKPACQAKCVCKPGMLRDENGKCISDKNCPTCGGDEYAESGCGVNCGKQCDDVFGKRPCPRICKGNACDCKDGYFYDQKRKKCVQPNDCSNPVCGPNAEYNSCANGGCFRAKTCEDLDKTNGSTVCVNVKKCIPGCICLPGYLKDDKGNCIKENTCPNAKCKNENEQLQCVTDCNVQTCDQLGYGPLCGNQDDTIRQCEPKCVCREGYLWDSEGNCVKTDECPSCGGDPGARPGCGIYCGNTCATYKRKGEIACIALCKENACDCKEGLVLDGNLNKCVPPETCTPTCGLNEVYDSCSNGGCYYARKCSDLSRNATICVKVAKCKPGCLCKDGYLKDDTGKCIPEWKCPNSNCKKANETYIPCPTGTCNVPQTCDDLGTPPKPCAPPYSGQCVGKAGCYCRNGYVKGKNGACISIYDCPSCGKDPNAKAGCGGYCGKKCSDINRGPVACTLECQSNACDCKEGYWYDELLKKCVLEKDCKTTCPKNEVYNSCYNGGCFGPRKCSEKGRSTLCVDLIDSSYCKAGCVCRKGYLRNGNGLCVSEDMCPKICTGTPGAGCNCKKHCEDYLGKQLACAAVVCQTPECECQGKDDYYSKTLKKCVYKDECCKNP